jgi:hypothetical protein
MAVTEELLVFTHGLNRRMLAGIVRGFWFEVGRATIAAPGRWIIEA